MCFATLVFGKETALIVGEIHEIYHPCSKDDIPTCFKNYDEFAEKDREMDDFNNKVGAGLGEGLVEYYKKRRRKTGPGPVMLPGTPSFGDACCNACKEALKDGKLQVNDPNGYEYKE
jgi:hypothetical protein